MPVDLVDPVDNFSPKPFIDMRSRRHFWTFLPVIALVVGLGLFLTQVQKPQRLASSASGGAVLSMIKDKTGLRAGDEFTLNLLLDTKDTQISNADIYLIYPENILQAESISGADYLPQVLDPGGVGPGTAFIRVANTTPQKGAGVIASVKFKAIASGNPAIGFTDETLLTDTSQKGLVTNLLDKAIGLKFSVK